ncbi:MAG: methyltransferase [Candidatus Marinimicrobia bacterium]|jgi:uroporphyrinogen decarboxylase|nr:methyltransferase [Candidatus Neomarinimicrobiota bacterium]
MPQTSREIVKDTLTFNYPSRIPREIISLPWAIKRYPKTVKEIETRFPNDICGVDYFYPTSPRVKGKENEIGKYTDEWGCEFVNILDGMMGEVKKPMLKDLPDWKSIKPPYEWLSTDFDKIKEITKKFCAETDKFVRANCIPRPWERYQFIRGTENAMMDCVVQDDDFFNLLNTIHQFYLKEFEMWAKTDVDGLMFMDDWGSQNSLLISPKLWREIFKPLYKEYCDIAHTNNKFIFMHSDGYIIDIYEDLIEIGVDAINSQLFCMDIEEIGRRFKGRITFWGEIDRQNVLPSKDPKIGRQAVQKFAKNLYDPNGGIIDQFEFGLDVNPETAIAVLEEWEKVNKRYLL